MSTTTRIDSKCGIYDTQYTITDHGDHMYVKEPYIKWRNNTGVLAFARWHIDDKRRMQTLRWMAEHDVLITDDDTYPVMIEDVIHGL